jgi:hypothetical protein
MIDTEVTKLINEAYAYSDYILRKLKFLIYDGAELLKKDKVIKVETLEELVNEKYSEIRQQLSESMRTKIPKKGATLLFRDCEEGVETDSRKIISQKVGSILFKFKAGEFCGQDVSPLARYPWVETQI